MNYECEDENLHVSFPEGGIRIQILPNRGVDFQAQPGAAFCSYLFAGCGWVGIPAICFGMCARLFSLEDLARTVLTIGSLLTTLWVAAFIGSFVERWPLRIVIDVPQRVVIVDEVNSIGRWRQTEFSLDDFEFLRIDSLRSKGGRCLHVVLVGEKQRLNLALYGSGDDANTTAAKLAKILGLPLQRPAA